MRSNLLVISRGELPERKASDQRGRKPLERFYNTEAVLGPRSLCPVAWRGPRIRRTRRKGEMLWRSHLVHLTAWAGVGVPRPSRCGRRRCGWKVSRGRVESDAAHARRTWMNSITVSRPPDDLGRAEAAFHVLLPFPCDNHRLFTPELQRVRWAP